MEKKIYTVQESFEEMQSIHLGNLKNAAHREFINDTLIEARRHEGVTANLARQVAALEAAYEEEMQASVIEETVQRLTDEVYQLAGGRSAAQTALKSGLRAVMGMTDAEKVAAATVLFELMHKYDLHTGMNVDEQTAVIDSFILDVDENHASQMTLTGMSELYGLLKEWNTRVCDKVIERDEAKVGLGTGRMANARLESDRAWRELRTAVNAFAYVQGDADYAAFIGYMNVLIVRYKRTHLGEKVESPEDVEGGAGSGEGGSTGGAGGSTGEGGGSGTGGSGSGTGGETTVPGGSGAGSGSDNGGSGSDNLVTLKFTFHSGRIEEIREQAGAAITVPTNTSGYAWSPDVPVKMPAANFCFIEIPEDASPLYTVAWYAPNGNPVQWYDLPEGMTVPPAPEPAPGYYWHPYYDTMPPRDMDIMSEPIRE